MAASSEEFMELIGSDVRTDAIKLRRLAFYGIPAEVRGKIWNLLLPTLVSASGRRELQDVGEATEVEEDYSVEDSRTDTEIYSVLRTEVVKYCSRHSQFNQPKVQQRMLNIISKYMQSLRSAPSHAYDPSIVHVLGPFVYLLKSDEEALGCYKLMLHVFIKQNSLRLSQRTTVGRFLMLLRSIVPQLYVHLEEEELDPSRWAVSWMKWLLCKELPFDCCLRLWDSYIAAPRGNGFELHLFVCLSILDICQRDLLELDQPELYSFLKHLPSMDIDIVIEKAQFLYRSVQF